MKTPKGRKVLYLATDFAKTILRCLHSKRRQRLLQRPTQLAKRAKNILNEYIHAPHLSNLLFYFFQQVVKAQIVALEMGYPKQPFHLFCPSC